MASQKLKYSDIAEIGLFDPLIKEVRQVNELLKVTADELKEVARVQGQIAKQTPFDNYENIQRKTKAIQDTLKATQDLDKLEKERVRLEAKLAGLEEDRAKANAELKVEIAERNRQLREEAKLSSESFTQYQKLSIRLGQLRNQYKEVAIQEGRNSKSAKDLRKEIGELSDTLEELDRDVKQQFREIGRYENALKKLNSTAGKLGALALLFKGLEALKDAFTANQAGADILAKALGRITITARVFIGRVIGAFGDLRDAGRKLQLDFREIGLNIQLFFAQLPSALGGSVQRTQELQQKVADLRAEYASLSGGTLQSVAKNFQGIGAEIQQGIKDLDKLIDKTTQYRKINIVLQQDLANLSAKQEKLRQVSEDNTISLEDQAEATEKLLAINTEISEKNIQIASQEVRLAKLRADTNLDNLEAQEAYSEALIALIEAQAQAEVQQAENAQRLREIERDNIELDLDQLIDLADRRKTVNETIAADERLSFQTRRQALEKALSDVEGSFRAQAEKIQEGIDAAFNIDDLVGEEDTVKLNERIKALGLDEIRQNRLREILQERIQATEDLRTAQDDLNESESEGKSIQGDILLQEQVLADLQSGSLDAQKVLNRLEKERIELQKENLALQIAQLEEGSIERIRLEQELNNLLIDQSRKRAEEEAKIEQDKIDQSRKRAEEEAKIEQDKYKKIGESAREGFQLIRDLSESFFDQRIEDIDEELNAAEKRENELRQLAISGNQTAEESLAAEQKRRAELEQQRAEQIKRQKLAELGLSAIETYGANVAAGKPNPLAATIADISLLQAFIESLPGFYEGAEMVGDALTPVLPGRDGHIIRVDGGERILTSSQNAMVPRDMSNMELAQMASRPIGTQDFHIASLGTKLDQVVRAIEGQETYKGMDFDNQREAVVFQIETRNKLIKKHKRIKSVFG